MSRAGMMTAAVAAAVAIAPGGAQAQPDERDPDTHELSTGYIGKELVDLEIDRCEERHRERTDDADLLRTRAHEHYDRATVLYEQGDYVGAVNEFVAAYCDAPHYSVLKDISQAYERQVEYERAVRYLERYILELPQDKAAERRRQSFRVQVLSNLPARIKVATAPPGASVTLTSSSGVSGRGKADADRAIEIRGGTYTMRVEMPGYEPVEQTIEPEIGQPYSYYFRLEPKSGTLSVVAQPPTARIFVDKRLVALGEYTAEVPIGTYTIDVEAERRQPTTREVEVTEGASVDVAVTLEKQPKSGRRQLIIASTAGGLIFGGGAFFTLFGDNLLLASVGATLGTGIGTVGAYFGVPEDITVGESSYIVGVTLVAAAEGALVSSLIACDFEERDEGGVSTSCKEGAIGASALISGVAGLAVGALSADRLGLDAGDAALVNSGAMWGSVTGSLFYLAFDSDDRLAAPLILGGLNLGIAAGGLLAARYDVSRGHTALIDLSGLAGMIVGVASATLVEQDSSERQAHFALAGMGVGLVTGAVLTRNMDRSRRTRAVTPSVGGARTQDGDAALTFGIRGSF